MQCCTIWMSEWYPYTSTLTLSRSLDWALHRVNCFASVFQAFFGLDRKYVLLRKVGVRETVLSCAWTESVVEKTDARCAAYTTMTSHTNVSHNCKYIESCSSYTKVTETHVSYRRYYSPNYLKRFFHWVGIWYLELFIKCLDIFTSRSHSLSGAKAENAMLIWTSVWTSLPTMHWQGFKCDAWL